jgi:hypothetical protein
MPTVSWNVPKRRKTKERPTPYIPCSVTDTENLINVSATQIWDQWSNTNSAFTRRVAETIEIKNKLQLHLHKVRSSIYFRMAERVMIHCRI